MTRKELSELLEDKYPLPEDHLDRDDDEIWDLYNNRYNLLKEIEEKFGLPDYFEDESENS